MRTLCATERATLTEDGGAVTLTVGDAVTRASLAEFIDRKIDAQVLDAFGLVPLVQARALAILGTAPAFPPQTRPSVPRIFSFGRGDPRCVWIRGRSVSAMAGEHRYDGTFEEFLAKGFPGAVADGLGADCVGKVRAAVESLAPLPCMCDTGADTDDQHGSIEWIADADNPRSYVEDRASVGRCRVCGRVWTFEVSGDPYYEMHYSATLFE